MMWCGLCRKSVENGIDIIRIFDALNDVRNLQTAIQTTKEAGGHCQAAIFILRVKFIPSITL